MTVHIHEIPFHLEPGEKLTLFLDHLNSEIRERMGSYGGSSGFDKNGRYTTGISGLFWLASGEQHISIALHFNQNSGLETIVGTVDDENLTNDSWKEEFANWVTSVSNAAFSDKKVRIYRRRLLCYRGEALSGEYWFGRIRFAPLIPNDAYPRSQSIERVVCIDQEVEAIDERHADQIAEIRAKSLAARLSLILNQAFYEPEFDHRWVVNDDHASELRQLHIPVDPPGPGRLPKKAELCPLGENDTSIRQLYKYAFEPMNVPSEARAIFRAIDTSPQEIKDKFDRAARLYQVGLNCGRFYPSVGLTYRVAAVETLTNPGKSGNKKAFIAFMERYSGSGEENSQIYGTLYSNVRSAHIHAGSFPSGEFARSRGLDAFTDASSDLKERELRFYYLLLRSALINWMLWQIAARHENVRSD